MDRMPPVPEHRVRPAHPPRVNDYDVLAEKPSFLCFLFFVLHAG